MGYYIALGIAVLMGFVTMLINFIERPDNDSGWQRNRQEQEWHPRWPPENERLSHKLRRWWEI